MFLGQQPLPMDLLAIDGFMRDRPRCFFASFARSPIETLPISGTSYKFRPAKYPFSATNRFGRLAGDADRGSEIALARTFSRDPGVLVLGRHGYETAIKGTNDFVCMDHA
jgi:hypothetical protein